MAQFKHFYYAATVEENGKQYSFGIKASNCDNLLAKFNSHKNLIFVLPCKTKKEMEEIVCMWNEVAEKNGNYMLSLDNFILN